MKLLHKFLSSPGGIVTGNRKLWAHELDVESNVLAKSIKEGPQKAIYELLDNINRQYITPTHMHGNRSKLEPLKPLDITAKFNWRRGYKDTILKVINERCNQYQKSSGSLQALLVTRPERMNYRKEALENKVIELDNLLRSYRKSKTTFADNTVLFENILNEYLRRLDIKFQEFNNNSRKVINSDVHFKWYIQIPNVYQFQKKKANYIRDKFEDTFLCYEVYWNNPEISVITDENQLLQKLPTGDILLKFGIRLMPLIKAIISEYYSLYDEDTNWNDVDFDGLLSNIRPASFERNTDHWERQQRYRMARTNDDMRQYSESEMRTINLMSKGIMLDSVNFENHVNHSISVHSRDMGYRGDSLLFPYIKDIQNMSTYSSGQVLASNEYIGKVKFEEEKESNHSPDTKLVKGHTQLRDICWGNMHNEIWDSVLRQEFPELLLHILTWSRFSIPGSNPLNKLWYMHFGMPHDFNEEYKIRVAQDHKNCSRRIRTHFGMEKGLIDYIKPEDYFATRNVPYDSDGNIMEGWQKQTHFTKINRDVISHCDKIQCDLRLDQCVSYRRTSQWLNDLYGTEEEEFPYGADIYGLTLQANAESEEQESIEIDDDNAMIIEEGDVLADPFDPDDTIVFTNDQLNELDSDQIQSDEMEDIENQMRTWVAARQGGR